MKLKDHFHREVSCREFIYSYKYIVPFECAYDGRDCVTEEFTRFFEDSMIIVYSCNMSTWCCGLDKARLVIAPPSDDE